VETKMAPNKTNRHVGKKISKVEKKVVSKKRRMKTKRIVGAGEGIYSNIMNRVSKVSSSMKETAKKAVNSAVESVVSVAKNVGKSAEEVLINGISLKQVLTRILNPANADRILYKNSFFLKFMEWNVITTTLYPNTTILDQCESYYIYKNEYLESKSKAEEQVKDIDSEVLVAGDEGVVSPLLSNEDSPTEPEKVIDKVDKFDQKWEKLKLLQSSNCYNSSSDSISKRVKEAAYDLLNRLTFTKLNDIPIIDRELAFKGDRFSGKRNGVDYIVFQEKYDCLYKFLHVYKYQINRLFWTSSEIIRFKKMGQLLNRMYGKLNSSAFSDKFKMKVLINLSLFPRGFNRLCSALKNLIQRRKEETTDEVINRDSTGSNDLSQGPVAPGTQGVEAPVEVPVAPGVLVTPSLLPVTSAPTTEGDKTPLELSTLKHGRIVGKLLKSYDIDSPVLNAVSVKFVLLTKKHPPFLLRESIFACKVAYAFLKPVDVTDSEGFDYLNKEKINQLSTYGKGGQMDEETKKIHAKFQKALDNCRSVLIDPKDGVDMYVNNKLNHAIDQLYSLKEAKQSKEGGIQKKKKKLGKRTKKRRGVVEGGGFFNFSNLTKNVKDLTKKAIAKTSDLATKTVKATMKSLGVDSVSYGFYEALEVIFHLTYKDMVNRLLNNIFNTLNETDIIHFFINLHQRNILLHSIFMNTMAFFLINMHRGFVITNVVDRFVTLVLNGLTSIPTIHFLVSLRLALNDIYYSTIKCNKDELNNLPLLKHSEYIPVNPKTIEPIGTTATTPSQTIITEPSSTVSPSTSKTNIDIGISSSTRDTPTPAPLIKFEKGDAVDDALKDKYFAFIDIVGFIKIVKLISYKYQDDRVIFNFDDGISQREYDFKTPFVLQPVYKCQPHSKDIELQSHISKIEEQSGPLNYGATKELGDLLLGQYLLVNEEYAGFVKQVDLVQTLLNTVSSSLSGKTERFFKSITLTLTSDGKTDYQVTINMKELVPSNKEVSESLFSSSKILHIVQVTEESSASEVASN